MEEIFHPSSKFTLSYYSSCKLKLGETSGGGGSTISCAGATTEAWFTNGSGAFHITVNDEFFENTNNWGVGYMINQIPELAAILYGDGDGDFRFFNKIPEFLRIKLEPIESDVWGIAESNNNPTIDINNEGVIQFCLAPMEVPEENPPFCYYIAGVGCYASASSLVESAIEHHNSNLRESEMEAYGAVSGTYIISSDQLSVSVSLLKIDGTLANIYTFAWVANPDLGS